MSIYTFIFFVSIIYVIRTILFKYGNSLEDKKQNHIQRNNKFFSVSIIIPARNEEKNITACVESLSKSTYPVNKFEIIVVDDRSDDNTFLLLLELQKRIKNLKVIKLDESSQKGNLLGKPGAVQAGIDNSSGEIILMTDADCVFKPDWISTLVHPYNNSEVLMVCSSTTTNLDTTFDVVQAIDWLYSSALARGGVGLNKVVGCFGNNFSIRRETFEKLGGYRKINFTVTEDFALMKSVDDLPSNTKSEKINKIMYLSNSNGLVITKACPSFSQYLKQKKRWALGGKALGWKAFVLVLTSLSLWTGIIASAALGKVHLSTFLIAIRIICDITILSPIIKKASYQKVFSWLIPSVCYFMVMELIIPFTLLSNKIEWKNQVFSDN